MSEIIVYSNLVNSSPVPQPFSDLLSLHNPLTAAAVIGGINDLKNFIATKIGEKIFTKKMEKDQRLKSMVVSYMMELDINPNEAERLENLRKLMAIYCSKEDNEQIETYAIYQIARKLTAYEFIVVSTAYKIFKEGKPEDTNIRHVNEWRQSISKRLNDSDSTRVLISNAEPNLINHSLIVNLDNREGYSSGKFRLTPLGYRMCQLLEEN